MGKSGSFVSGHHNRCKGPEVGDKDVSESGAQDAMRPEQYVGSRLMLVSVSGDLGPFPERSGNTSKCQAES